jgi:hypothetical protein
MAIKQPDDENRQSRAPDGAQIQAKLGPEMPGDIRTKPSLGPSPGLGAAVPGFLGRLFAGATTNVSTQTELQNGRVNGPKNGLGPVLEPPTDDPSGLPVIPGRPVKADATPDVMMSNLPEGYLKNLMARAQSGDDVALELLGGNFPGASGTDNESVRKRKEKEAQEDFYHDALRRMLEDIDRQMEALAQEIAELEIEIEQRRKELAELREREAEIERALQYYIKNGDFELDQEGHLKNKKWEEELRLFEQRTGQKVDRNDPREVFVALHSQNADIVKLEKEAENDIDGLHRKIDTRKTKLNDLQQNRNQALGLSDNQIKESTPTKQSVSDNSLRFLDQLDSLPGVAPSEETSELDKDSTPNNQEVSVPKPNLGR